MKKFKLHIGKNHVYHLTKEIYEDATLLKKPYKQQEKNGSTHYFAVCPACDNPIQIIGLYAKTDSTPGIYGRHYNRDTNIAKHNEQMYRFCPYATHKYTVNKDSKKPELTEFEKNVYYTLRENFDIAVKIIEQDTGLYITDNLARLMLEDFISCEGHMYYWTTLYNIPWMLLYFLSARNCYGMLVKIDSLFYDLLKKQKDVSLVQSSMKDYWCVRNKDNQYLNLSISAIHHKRNIVNDTLEESIKVWFFKNKEDFAPQKLFSITLQINEYRFLNWISSPKAEQYRNGARNQRLLEIAKEIMPDL